MPAQVLCVTFDCHDVARVATFWKAALGYVDEEPEEEGWAEIADPMGIGPVLVFGPVPEPKVVKNRVHLDLRPETTLAAEVERLITLGANVVEARGHDTWNWTVMLDPEGNEFCVCEPITEHA